MDWTLEANDLLVNRRNKEYPEGLLGDIKIGKNVLSGKSDDRVETRKGLQLKFWDAFRFGFGWFNGPGWVDQNPKTIGFGISGKGLLKLMAAYSNNPQIISVAKHFDFRYSWIDYSADDDRPLDGTTYQSIGLFVTGF